MNLRLLAGLLAVALIVLGQHQVSNAQVLGLSEPDEIELGRRIAAETTGLVILMVQQGMLPAEAAIPVVGANIGTTSTALIASVNMSPVARATAIANFLFNAAGVVAFLPVMTMFSRAVVERTASADAAVAWAHLIFNLGVALVFLASLRWVEPILARRLGVRGVPHVAVSS